MQKIYVCFVNTKRVDAPHEFGISDIGHVYDNKENAVKQILEYGYKAIEGEAEIFEKISKDGTYRHTYKIVEKYVWDRS